VTRTAAARTAGLLAAVVAAYVLAANLMPNGLPWGVVLLGLVLGSLSSLVALGLVLVYRAFRIVNFAQLAMGAGAAALGIVLYTGYHWPYVAAVGASLVMAVVIGLVVDALFQWRFVNSPRLIATVATIGLLLLLGALQVGLPHIVDHPLSLVTTFTPPFHLKFTVNDTAFTANDIVAMVAVPLVAGAVWWFLARSRTGLAVRAAADSSERALLLGIPVRRINRVVWVLAALLACIGALLTVPITRAVPGVAAGPATLLVPLAAAVLARFRSLPATVGWSLLIGVMQQSVYWSTGNYTYSDIGLFVLIVAGLALQRGGSVRDRVEQWVTVREHRRIPSPLASLPEVRASRWLGLTAIVALVVLFPLLASLAVVRPLTTAAIFAIVAVSLVVLTGWGGQISLGQFGFVGIGCAVTGALVVHAGADLFVALGCSAVAGALVACCIGLPALRLPGLQLAVVTLAFAVVVSEWLLSPTFFPSLNPTLTPKPVLFGRFGLTSQVSMYELCVVLLLASLLLARNFRRSRAGRALLASRDGPQAAASFGISPWRAQLSGFALSGALCGVAGGLYLVASPTGTVKITSVLSITVFTMTVIGGLGSLSGGLLGAAYVWACINWAKGGLATLATGAGLLLLLAVFPEGLAGIVFRARDRLLRAIARRRGLEVTSFSRVADEGDGDEPGVAGETGGLLTTIGLDVAIGSVGVLRSVDFSVDAGEVVALLGTNGAGKSTLLRAAAGLLPPSAGRVWFDGRDVTADSPMARVRAGMVTLPGGRGVFPSLTVGENLHLAGWTARDEPEALAEARRRVAELFPVLQRRLGTRAGDLSGGEQQMLAFAQALLCRPKLLLIDELSLGLAPTIVGELLDVVRQLVASGVAVVVVEQSVNVAAEIAKRAVFLERGRVRFRGPLYDLIERPDLMRSVFVGRAAAALPAGAPATAAADGPAAFEVRGAHKQFGGVAALSEVSVSVAPGEILGIIGANGAGKTTLLDVASGFCAPDGGRVVFGGSEVTGWAASRRAAAGLGRTFQDALVFPAMTVAEALATASDRHVAVRDPFLCTVWTHAVARSEQAVRHRVDELLDTLGLADLRDVPVAELSTGLRRIVSLACALAFEPEVLLLDEPSAGVAQRESEALVPMLRQLRDRTGSAFVVIDHDVPLLASLVDRLVCMHLGEVLAEGRPADVLADPAVIAAYLGEDEAVVARSGAAGGRGSFGDS
jgi:ABC-type branched-subunit amino acid transport system ATPase component/ABC-type branched-subunit amino acid transport system permease subunit